MPEPIDNETREVAVSELERNIVVIAGAGTGKTTLLVNRLLHVLLGHKRLQKEESPILRIVAMTFTEKAASDMKVRLMGELEGIVAAINGSASPEELKKREKFLAHIRDVYHTTHAEIECRARKSLEDMDKALIGTIHSFAAHILRLYPIESGVVPGFIVDEGDAFDELFDKEWNIWIAEELTLTSPRAHLWKDVLRRLDLAYLKDLAKKLSGFTIPLESLTPEMDDTSVTAHQHPRSSLHILPSLGGKGLGGVVPGKTSTLKTLIEPVQTKILKIIPHCEKPNNNLLSQLHELSKILDAIKKQGIGYLHALEYDLDKKASEAKNGWADEGFETAQEVVKECHAFLKKLKKVDDGFISATTSLILSFAKAFRQSYLSQGYVSFDGLLSLTRDLLQRKEHRYIREKLKNDFRVMLVDEFQDTDPVQYEIVLFLSEEPGHYSTDVRKITLEEGKLFIVGDPKQSIYAFRRADIEAYEQVVHQVCGPDGPLKLQENFRSHSGIIEVVNQLFDGRIMVEQPGLQACYIPIHAQRQKRHPFQNVDIVLVSDKEGNELKADEAREAEAEWIARWIARHVNHETMEDPLAENRNRKLAYKDVALLLRAFTQVRPYVEALKRYNIPYIVEGEKYFYSTQEILDFINLLRIIENPHDLIALVGVLRSPLVGLTDREIYSLHANHLLDYRKEILNETPLSCRAPKDNENDPPQFRFTKERFREISKEEMRNSSPDFNGIAEAFYGFLRECHARAGIIPVSQLIAEILDNTHIAEITASAWHGEQKLANLWKLCQMACDMEESAGISLRTFINRIKVRVKEGREEGESPLSDETLDIVKILTIHKSKGLEFPVVILGNLHGEVRNDREPLDGAVFDWSTSTTGIVVGRGDQQVRNLQSMVIEKKLNDRSWEEEKRVLYVATTRAKERLILTGSLKDDDKSYMGLIAQSLRDAAGIKLEEEVFTNSGYTREDKPSPSPNLSHQGRGNSEESTSGDKNKTYDGNKTGEEDKPGTKKFLLALREKDRTGGVSKGKFTLGRAEVLVENFRFDGTYHPQQALTEKTWDIDWSAFIEVRKERDAVMSEAVRKPLFVSPTTIALEEAMKEGISATSGKTVGMSQLRPDEFEKHNGGTRKASHFATPLSPLSKGCEVIKPKGLQPDTEQPNSDQTALVGSICHRVLEEWDFQGTKEGLEKLVDSVIKWAITLERGAALKQQEVSFEAMQNQDVKCIKAEVIKIFAEFIGSEAYKELQVAQILGREVPILLNWNGQIIRGIIDILYKIDGHLIVADYKTDQITITGLPARAEKYRHQKSVYREAVKRCLKIDNPEFKLIFLRLGKAVTI